MKLLCEIMGFYDADVDGGAVQLIVTKYVCATGDDGDGDGDGDDDGGATVQLIVTKYVCATLVPCCAD